MGLHTASSIIWDKLKEFADKLSDSLEFKPAGRVDIDLFIGKYKSTHSGIHYDGAHNFSITFRGHKKMYTWSKDFSYLNGIKYPDYEQYKESSLVLNNLQDRVCYFSHDTFHVAESPQDVSVVLNIAFWENSEKPKNILSFIKNNFLFSDNSREKICTNGEYKLSDSILLNEQFYNIFKNHGLLEKYIIQYELMQNTCSNLNLSRPSDDYTPLADNSLVSMKENTIIQWHIINDNDEEEIIISSNGHAATLKFNSEIIPILTKLIQKNKIHIGKHKSMRCIFDLLRKWGSI